MPGCFEVLKQINYLAVVVCTIIAMAVGALWYSKVLFGNAWMKGVGLNPEDVKKGDIVTIVTPGTEARLCPQPGCGPDQHITRIPAGTVFTVQNTEVFTIGTFKVKWFEVIYDNQHGWISIFDTDKSKSIESQ